MTTPPLPIDTSPIDAALVDPAHEAMRQTVKAALVAFWTQHVQLVNEFTAAQQALTDLTARVAALENPPAATPASTPTP